MTRGGNQGGATRLVLILAAGLQPLQGNTVPDKYGTATVTGLAVPGAIGPDGYPPSVNNEEYQRFLQREERLNAEAVQENEALRAFLSRRAIEAQKAGLSPKEHEKRQTEEQEDDKVPVVHADGSFTPGTSGSAGCRLPVRFGFGIEEITVSEKSTWAGTSVRELRGRADSCVAGHVLHYGTSCYVRCESGLLPSGGIVGEYEHGHGDDHGPFHYEHTPPYPNVAGHSHKEHGERPVYGMYTCEKQGSDVKLIAPTLTCSVPECQFGHNSQGQCHAGEELISPAHLFKINSGWTVTEEMRAGGFKRQ